MSAFFPGLEFIIRLVIDHTQYRDCEGIEEEIFNEKRLEIVMKALFGPNYIVRNYKPPKGFAYSHIQEICKAYSEHIPLETAIHKTVNSVYPLPVKPHTQDENELDAYYKSDVDICNDRDDAFERLKKFFQRRPSLTALSEDTDAIASLLQDIEVEEKKVSEALRKCGWPI